MAESFDALYAPPKAPTALADDSGTLPPRQAFADGQWAPYWHRATAAWLDGIILWLPNVVIGLGLGIVGGRLGFDPVHVGVASYLLLVLIHGAYQALMLPGPRAATLGRRAVGIAVVSAETGQPISPLRAFLRSIVSMVSVLTILPTLLQLLPPRRRALSDLLAGTVVVRYRRGGGVIVLIMLGLFIGVFVLGIVAAVAIPQYQHYVERARARSSQPLPSPTP